MQYLKTPDPNASMQVFCNFLQEGNYMFHCIACAPTDEHDGYPGPSNAVNPAFQSGIIHTTGFDARILNSDAAWQKQRYARLNMFTQHMRDATPAYRNGVNIQATEEFIWTPLTTAVMY